MSRQPAGPMQEFAVAEVCKRTWVTLLLLTLILPLVVIGIAVNQSSADSTGSIVPAAAIVLLVTAGLVTALRRRRIRLGQGLLRVDVAMYRRKIPLRDLDLMASRVVNLDEEPALRPILKSNGIWLPGYLGGHFRLRGWRKAFCLVTDRSRVLSVPDKTGELLLLSPARPRALQQALQAAHAG